MLVGHNGSMAGGVLPRVGLNLGEAYILKMIGRYSYLPLRIGD